MVQQISLQAELREATGKGPGRRLRAQGRVPGIVYGSSHDPVKISVGGRDLQHLVALAGEHAVVSLQLGQDAREDVMLQDSQRDPITERLVHADFYRIDLNKPIEVEVPIESEGTAAGVKDGGLLERVIRAIEVRCLPLKKPDVIRVNVTELRIGHSIHVSEIPAIEGVEFLTPPDTALYTVLVPRKEEEVVAAPVEGEVAEPELITKGKGEEEEGEEAEGGKKEGKAEAKTEKTEKKAEKAEKKEGKK